MGSGEEVADRGVAEEWKAALAGEGDEADRSRPLPPTHALSDGGLGRSMRRVHRISDRKASPSSQGRTRGHPASGTIGNTSPRRKD